MPTYVSRVLVLSKTKLKEKDLILTLLAEDGSQIRAVAKGARSTRSKLGGTCELFSVVDALIARGRNLDIITEARGVETNEACRRDLEHSAAAEAVCETLVKMTLPEEGEPHLFDMALAALSAIGGADALHARLVTAAFILKCTSMLGYRPELRECINCGRPVGATTSEAESFSFALGGVVCPSCQDECPSAVLFPHGIIAWVRALLYSTFPQIASLEGAEDVTTDLLRFSQRWLREHAGVDVKSLAFMFIDL